ncbi:hypothetical protein BI004_gp292 [Bacillus phage NotTheCreek]|uniref:Uncharacterized protein n=3 Tax=Wphvirus TaxID=1922327 RepID=A0A222Z361_9CAUD|nr:hypothetical protein FP72_gp292 [Bacillus phage Hakuna]YP_009281099.1 hypothetical protein SAGEFAYGE_296 [Bacillus phage SageFayge]YP_009284620.1 hypothetical protein BI004_gp292 [Bacillus phage NotTheCreek]ASR78236.1 hypothetical protein PPISBEST_297 [Bacillus phage PPIsBest]QDH49570.1 hypothetical protein PHIREBALL_296 [Bacillus phage Phireball]QDH50277.1 hypothetical protein ALPS_291 [Bacillus phage ALPS]ULF49201.1 hypothetical protein [Bacillus phage Darren]AHZ10310.1 hypothetical pro
MLTVTLIDVLSGVKEKRDFSNEESLQKYLSRNPFVIVKRGA